MNNTNEQWPALPYEDFKSTGYLLHMLIQAIGKFKLNTPFDPHWGNVALWLTSRGLTTGPIPQQGNSYSIDLDLINHEVYCQDSTGRIEKFAIKSMSVADLTKELFSALKKFNIDTNINMTPQEVPEPIAFDQDFFKREYDYQLANAWWRILLSSYNVMQLYHSHFNGETPPVGLMWGTFDLRDARYNGKPVETSGVNSGYIRRNAMNEAQVEVGFWSGHSLYPKAAYYSFTYPQPPEIELAIIKPKTARWDTSLGEFILDYDDLRQSRHPAEELLAFFESTYEAGATLAGWDPKLVVEGVPR